jgi:hypothetical protein
MKIYLFIGFHWAKVDRYDVFLKGGKCQSQRVDGRYPTLLRNHPINKLSVLLPSNFQKL